MAGGALYSNVFNKEEWGQVMNIRTRCNAVLVAVLVAGTYLSPISADESTAPAYGLVNMTLGCDKTPDGLRIGILDEVSREKMRKKHGLDIKLGDPCLATMAMIPIRPRFATFSGGGIDTTIDECLIWIIDGANVSENEPVDLVGFGTFIVKKRSRVIACDVTEEGSLETVFVDGVDGYTLEPGESCGVTRGALGGNSYPVKWTGPISATLGHVTGIPVGGLMWVGTGHGIVEVLECNLNEEGDGLVVTHRENAEGVDTAALGESCLDMLVAREGETGSLQFSGPFPIPQDETIDPDCLIWDIQGGTVEPLP